MSKHTIWNSDATEYDFEEARRNCAGANGEPPEEVSDEAVWDFIHREIDQWYEDESMNLNKPTGRILCYGSLGLWWGRPTGYRMIDGGNLNAVLGQACRDSYDYHVYFDGRDVCADDTHHARCLVLGSTLTSSRTAGSLRRLAAAATGTNATPNSCSRTWKPPPGEGLYSESSIPWDYWTLHGHTGRKRKQQPPCRQDGGKGNNNPKKGKIKCSSDRESWRTTRSRRSCSTSTTRRSTIN